MISNRPELKLYKEEYLKVKSYPFFQGEEYITCGLYDSPSLCSLRGRPIASLALLPTPSSEYMINHYKRLLVSMSLKNASVSKVIEDLDKPETYTLRDFYLEYMLTDSFKDYISRTHAQFLYLGLIVRSSWAFEKNTSCFESGPFFIASNYSYKNKLAVVPFKRMFNESVIGTVNPLARFAGHKNYVPIDISKIKSYNMTGSNVITKTINNRVFIPKSYFNKQIPAPLYNNIFI